VSSTPLRGWYPDPSGAPRQRYWDGQQWTAHAPAPHALGRSGLWIALSVIAVVVLFFGGCSVLVAAGSKSSNAPRSDSFGGPFAPLGTPVHDGELEFVVSDVSTPGDVRSAPRPRGQWIIATMTVRNLDDEPQEFVANNQKLIDSTGHTYAADTAAAVAINRTSMVIAMHPGTDIAMKVPFDVPAGALPTAIELHDSVFSSGVRVQLT
jgi:hypothetical protein